MEQVFEGMGTLLHAFLGLAIVIGPGMLFWLVVASVVLAIRWVGHRGSVQSVHHESQTASSPSTVKS